MDLWLHANIESHSFIEADYWKKNYDMVRKLIPEAKVFVAEENEEILGFIGLTDTYIAGIFVKETEQSKGIGRKSHSVLDKGYTLVRLAKVHLANQNTFPANFPKKAAKNHANLKGDSSKFNNSLFYRFICYQIRHI